MYVQGVESVYDLAFNSPSPSGEGQGAGEVWTYGDVFLDNEREFSAWNFERANTEALFRWFRDSADECRACIEAALPLPAYDQAIKASHIFNLLNARGVISVAERQAYIGRVRDLTKGACQAWVEKNGWEG
jgi:glycyl-tRNA synthetase alpha chain